MKILLPFLLILYPLLAVAQREISSLEDALQLAKHNNLTIKASLLSAETERAKLNGIYASYLPQLKGISRLDYNYALPVQLIPAELLGGKEGEMKSIQFGTKYMLTAGLEAQMPLLNTSLWAETKMVSLLAAAAKEKAESVEKDVLGQLAQTYYLSLLAAQSVRISEKNLQSADTILAVAQSRFNQQLIDQLDLNRIINQHLRLKNEYEEQKVLYHHSIRSLKFLLGLKQSDSIILSEQRKATLPEYKPAFAAFTFSEVKAKSLLMEAALWNYRKQHLKRLPELSLYGSFYKQAQRNETDFFQEDKPWFESGLLGLRLEVPLFSGTSSYSLTRKAKLAYRISKLEYEQQLEKELLEEQELLLNLKLRKKAAANWERAYKNTEENLRLAYLKYQQGLLGTDQYLDVMQESLEVQQQFLSALTAYYITSASLQLKSEKP